MKKITGFVTVTTLVSLFVYSCQKENSVNGDPLINKPHKVTIFLTDHQTPVFDSVFIDLEKLEIKLEDNNLPGGGWVALNIRTGIYNILRFRNGIDTLFATGAIPNAGIRKIRLTLGTQNSVMKNGQSFPLQVKDEDREVVAEIQSSHFEITPSGQVLFWIDFDASRSIQVDNSGPGNGNGYRLKSCIKIFTKNNTGEIEGKVGPLAADALVIAIHGTDSSMAVPDDHNGSFKIVGLDAGNYTVFIDGNNNYRDTIINNVIVRNRENTRLPPITLHQ